MRSGLMLGLVLAALLLATPLAAEESVVLSRDDAGRVSVVVRDAPLIEVFEMLARKERVSVLLASGVEGNVSVNLFDVSVDRAIRVIADAAGYVAERRHGAYVVIQRDEVGKDNADGNTMIRAFKVENSDPEKISQIVEKHLSRYGEVTILEERRMLVVEDLPEFLLRVERLLGEIDRDPSLILIQARILEIQLDEDEKIGIDWEIPFDKGSIGVRDLAFPGGNFFFDLLTTDIEIQISALMSKGRVRTLSTPTLLAVEHQEAEVLIGDRLGYRVTTTINQVTTESVEFLNSGVILRFEASVDRQGRVVLDVHPEVSTGSIRGGLPQQRTTEVTTRLRAESGQSVFIAGLIRDSEVDTRTGVPFLMDIPLLGRLFTRSVTTDVNTETVVILTAHILEDGMGPENAAKVGRTRAMRQMLEDSRERREQRVVPVDPVTESLGGVPFGGGNREPGARPDASPEPTPAPAAPTAP